MKDWAYRGIVPRGIMYAEDFSLTLDSNLTNEMDSAESHGGILDSLDMRASASSNYYDTGGNLSSSQLAVLSTVNLTFQVGNKLIDTEYGMFLLIFLLNLFILLNNNNKKNI